MLATNDGTAGGAIQALSEEGLAGKVLVTGQDAELVALPAHRRRHADDDDLQAAQARSPHGAAELAVKLAERQRRGRHSRRVNNGKIDVPAVLYDVVTVTKENIVRDRGQRRLASYDEVYRGIPEVRAAADAVSGEVILSARDIVKRFGGVTALAGRELRAARRRDARALRRERRGQIDADQAARRRPPARQLRGRDP